MTPSAHSCSDITCLAHMCHLFSVTHRDGRLWFLAQSWQWTTGWVRKTHSCRPAFLSGICKQISRATPGTSPRCNGQDVFWNTPEHTLHPHSCPVATATLLMGQPLPLLPAPGSRGIFTTHYYFEAQFLLHCTGCLLSIEFLKINLTVASIKKKDVTGFVCCNADFMRFSPYNNQHHISSHLISHHCHTAFPSILPGTKRRAALRTVSLKKTPWSTSLGVSLRTCTSFIWGCLSWHQAQILTTILQTWAELLGPSLELRAIGITAAQVLRESVAPR